MVDRNKLRKQVFLAQCLRDCILDHDLRNLKVLLQDNNADPGIILPDDGCSVLHLACWEEIDDDFGAQACHIFIKLGVSSNLRCSPMELTPLHVAAAAGKVKTLYELLQCGADPFLYDINGKLPFHYAMEEDRILAADILLQFMVNNSLQIKIIPNTESLNTTIEENEIYNSANTSILAADNSLLTENSIPKTTKVQIHNIPKILCNDETLMFSCEDLISEDRSDDEISLQFIINRSVVPSNSLPILQTPPKIVISSPDMVHSNSKVHNIPKLQCNDETLISEDYSDEEISLEFNTNGFTTPPNCTPPNVGISPIKVVQQHSHITSPCGYNNHDTSFIAGMLPLDKDELIRSDSKVIKTYYHQEEDCSIIAGMFDVTPQRDSSTLRVKYVKSEGSKPRYVASPNLEETYHDAKRKLILDCEIKETVLTAAEQYKHIDKHEGVEFIEKWFMNKPYDLQIEESGIEPLVSSNSDQWNNEPIPSDYDTDQLHADLTSLGYTPGPITTTTKRIYLRKLIQLCSVPVQIQPPKQITTYSLELEKTFRNPTWTENLTQCIQLEAELESYFQNTKKVWRGGKTKSSFTYLLLDPRITLNLPLRQKLLTPIELWKTFIQSIFYVGKGKRSRPYAHLYDAIRLWNKLSDPNTKLVTNSKLEYIINIWKEQHGVICLHIFQNVLPVEAFTREAVMIEAIRLQNLKNTKSGDIYGCAMKWKQKEKQMFGTYLLYKAMNILLHEGERQLMPADID